MVRARERANRKMVTERKASERERKRKHYSVQNVRVTAHSVYNMYTFVKGLFDTKLNKPTKRVANIIVYLLFYKIIFGHALFCFVSIRLVSFERVPVNAIECVCVCFCTLLLLLCCLFSLCSFQSDGSLYIFFILFFPLTFT